MSKLTLVALLLVLACALVVGQEDVGLTQNVTAVEHADQPVVLRFFFEHPLLVLSVVALIVVVAMPGKHRNDYDLLGALIVGSVKLRREGRT